MNGDVQIFATSGLKQITREQFDELERRMLEQEQLDFEVKHVFAAGLYVREAEMLPGLWLGHEHKETHHCVVLKGRMNLLTEDGIVTEICAPCAFIGKPGRKLVLVREPVVMQNIHATGDWPAECHSEIEAMENHLYRKSRFLNDELVEQEQQQHQVGIATGIGLTAGLAVIGTTAAVGATTYGIVHGQHLSKTANDQAKKATAQQAQAQQIATIQGQAQAAIDTANASTKKWEYIAIGGVVLIVVGGVIYAVTRKKK